MRRIGVRPANSAHTRQLTTDQKLPNQRQQVRTKHTLQEARDKQEAPPEHLQQDTAKERQEGHETTGF